MPRATWPEAIRQALFATYIDGSNMLLQVGGWDEENATVILDWEELLAAFAQCWGGVDAEACKRALAGDYAQDRLFALFALGALAPADVEGLLLPFLCSLVPQERWASVIVLGRRKHAQAWPLLLTCLPEHLEGTCAVPDNEEALLDPTAGANQEDDWDRDDRWFLLYRSEIALLLGSWGDPRAIPVLAYTFRIALTQEPGPSDLIDDIWYDLEDHLAYALGQLGAWHVLDDLGLSPERWHVARMYFVLGVLRVNTTYLFTWEGLNLLCGDEKWRGTLADREALSMSMLRAKSVAEQRAVRELPGLVSPISEVLHERWGMTPEECRAAFRNWFRWYGERLCDPSSVSVSDLWYPEPATELSEEG